MFPYLGNFKEILPYDEIINFYENTPLNQWDVLCSALENHLYEYRPYNEKFQTQFYGVHNSKHNSLVVTNKDFFPDAWFKKVKAKKKGYVAKLFHTKPGTIEPPHKDFFPSFLNNINPDNHEPITENNIEEVGRKIIRCWIPLTDSALGHLLFSENYCLSSWKQGDVFELPSGNTHGFANAGSTHRYLLVFTAWRNND